MTTEMKARFGTLATGIWFCRACGRSTRSIEGHDQVLYCCYCGSYRSCEETKDTEPCSILFGKQGWWPAPWRAQEVEFPSDVRYDPWAGTPVDADGFYAFNENPERSVGLFGEQVAKMPEVFGTD